MSEHKSKVQRVLEIRRSNAATPQNTRAKRARTRQAARLAAIRDSK